MMVFYLDIACYITDERSAQIPEIIYSGLQIPTTRKPPLNSNTPALKGRKETYRPYSDALIALTHFYDYAARQDEQLVHCHLGRQTTVSAAGAGVEAVPYPFAPRPSASTEPVDSDSGETGTPLDGRRSCLFDLDWGHRCNMWRDFGYEDGSPCFVLTLNPVYGWLPSLESTEETKEGSTTDEGSSAGVQVCCGGASPQDEEWYGDLCYYDALVHSEREGCARRCGLFPHHFFPYLAQENYLKPIVFVEVRNMKRNVVVRFKCQLRARNANAQIQFEMLMD
ncbi:unnamed protein product [Protopolystoma xenopodis]|uniref:Uncharacterized protein n=1 Tax=Protopolystoma xenopodis TaxID=117903 RepID=A0A3S5ABY9_9PLAT|nr:unnamed protein product [Protopolystoma xenopodis]